MVCFELSLNNEIVARIGGATLNSFGISSSYRKDSGKLLLSASGLDQPEDNFFQQVKWLKNKPLSKDDEILIKIVDCDQTDDYQVVAKYGTKHDGAVPEYYCSFCGSAADINNGMFISQHANICHTCLKKYSENLLKD